MRKIFYLLILLCSIMVSCSRGNNPADVTRNFLENAEKGNFEEAKKYCDEPTARLLDMLVSLGGKKMKEEFEKKGKAINIEITRVEEDGDKAVVYYKENDNSNETKVELNKINGDWKVSIDKESAKEEKNRKDIKTDHSIEETKE